MPPNLSAVVTQKLTLTLVGQDSSMAKTLDAAEPPPRGWWLIGRHPTADVLFRNILVSAKHAAISVRPSLDTTEGGTIIYEWKIYDLGSSNGTWLNGYRLNQKIPYAISEDAVIQLGTISARLKCSFFDYDTLSSNPDAPSESNASPLSPWFVPAILEPAWVWFIAQPPIFQALILAMVTAIAIFWIHSN